MSDFESLERYQGEPIRRYGADPHRDTPHERPLILNEPWGEQDDLVACPNLRRKAAWLFWRVLWGVCAGTILYFAWADKSHADPACWPYRDNSTRAYVSVNTTGFAVAWFCDINHLWYRNGFAGHWGDLLPNWQSQPAAQANATDSDYLAAWRANITGDLNSATSADHDMLALYQSTGTPDHFPLSGLVTHAEWPTVYKQSQQLGTYTIKAYGTVTAGVPCDTKTMVSDANGRYFAVPRSAVKLSSFIDTYATTTYARCD